MGIKVSILGATGNVGREFLSIIKERKFPIEELYLLASPKSEGKEISLLGGGNSYQISTNDIKKLIVINGKKII